MRVICRKPDDATSARVVEVDSDFFSIAADTYVDKHFDAKQGDVVFVEVIDPRNEKVQLWRVECVWPFGVRAYMTGLCTREQMQNELARRT